MLLVTFIFSPWQGAVDMGPSSIPSHPFARHYLCALLHERACHPFSKNTVARYNVQSGVCSICESYTRAQRRGGESRMSHLSENTIITSTYVSTCSEALQAVELSEPQSGPIEGIKIKS